MATDIEKVRTAIGDTTDDELLTDTEITTYLTGRTLLNSTGGTIQVNVEAAAADAASAIAAKFARDFDFSEDGQNFQRAQRVGHYVALERELRSRAGAYAVSTGGTATT